MIRKGSISIEGNYVGEEGVARPGRIVVSDGIITEISGLTGIADAVFDSRKVIMPGFINPHVHGRQFALPANPTEDQLKLYRAATAKEDFASLSRAAINGGVVAVGEMPNNPPGFAPVDAESYRAKEEVARRDFLVDHMTYALLTPDSSPFGNLPYKLFTHDFSDIDLDNVFRRFRGLGYRITLHCENKDTVRIMSARPPTAELMDIYTCIELSDKYSVPIHITHVSTGKGLELIVSARKSGTAVTCDTTPTYLFFSQTNSRGSTHSSWLTMKPPLRSELDRYALMGGIVEGSIDMLATDHAPHTVADKKAGVFGIPLEDHYTNFVGWLLQEGVSMQRVVEMCCTNPGKMFNRFKGEKFGAIALGYVGSFTVVDKLPSEPIDLVKGPARIMTKCGWSPFEGVKLGEEYLLTAHETIVRGVRMKRA